MRTGALRFLSRSRLGSRGAFLLCFAFIHLLYGYSVMFPDPNSVSRADMVWRNQYAPPHVWGTIWIAVGALCLLTAFVRQDRAGYAAAVAWLIFWSFQCASSQIWGGYSRGYVTAGIFGTFCVIGLIASGVTERPGAPPRLGVADPGDHPDDDHTRPEGRS